MASVPFDESHTAENINATLTKVLEDWNILDKTGPSLRDNAANMVAAFNVPGSTLVGIGCLNHTLQLVIKDGLFSLRSVKSLIEKCHALIAHANMSTIWYHELYEQQEKFNITGRRSLRRDIDVRYVADIVSQRLQCQLSFHLYI